MQLSIVIVNYNVKFFLEQCLNSVFEAARGIDTEVWVVDNNSVDGSVAMVKEKFPQVRLIANKDNPGFSKANNQALRQISGDYALLLNPDTLVEKDTFRKCIDFMEATPDCGGLGVKMINGEGKFLPESKRGFPTPEVAFYKISGLIKLFPHSPKFARYYLGHLDENETCEIDILSGAYLMIRKAALDKTGLLDETFFMYGEDIDFSYRITQAGYKNYYLPTARIIHYKGESTKKGSMNYVYTFYNAMVIFTKKHFSDSGAKLFTFCIKMAIWLRASLAFVKRLFSRIAVPLLDFLVIFCGFLAIKNAWATIKANDINYYPPEYTWLVMPIYVILWIFCIYWYGGYRKPVKLVKIAKGVVVGTGLLLVFYSLLDETQRYSRAMILLGTAWAMISTIGLRGILHLFRVNGYDLRNERQKSYLIVGDKKETLRVSELFKTIGIDSAFTGFVSNSDTGDSHFIGTVDQLDELVRFYKTDEVIFCSKNLQPNDIITLMTSLQNHNIEYKIVPQESQFIIGSNDIYSTEDLYTVSINSLSQAEKRRNKRLFDILSAILILTLSPVLFWFQRRKTRFFGDIFKVIFARRSWVGYCNAASQTDKSLPHTRKGIFTPRDMSKNNRMKDTAYLNLMYARNYRVSTDFVILLRNLRNI